MKGVGEGRLEGRRRGGRRRRRREEGGGEREPRIGRGHYGRRSRPYPLGARPAWGGFEEGDRGARYARRGGGDVRVRGRACMATGGRAGHLDAFWTKNSAVGHLRSRHHRLDRSSLHNSEWLSGSVARTSSAERHPSSHAFRSHGTPPSTSELMSEGLRPSRGVSTHDAAFARKLM